MNSFRVRMQGGVRLPLVTAFALGLGLSSLAALPDAYVETTGTQYFITDVKAGCNVKVVMDFMNRGENIDGDKQQRFFGTDGDSSSFVFSLSAYHNGNHYLSYAAQDGVGNWTSTGWGLDNTTRRTFTVDAYGNKWDLRNSGATSATHSGAMGTTRTKTGGAYLGIAVDNRQDSPLMPADMRLYSFKTYESGILKRCYVPYWDNAKTGLFEVVTGTFLTNCWLSGSEPLLVGGTPATDYNVYLVDSDGAQWSTENSRIEWNTTVTPSDSAGGSVSVNGSVTTDPVELWSPTGESLTLIATAASGWDFVGWQGDTTGYTAAQLRQATLAVSVDRPRSLIARFVERSTTNLSAYDYQRDGLIAQWDAVENAGYGYHLASPGSWAELVSGATVTHSGALTYNASNVVFGGSSYFSSSISAVQTALAATNMTVELFLRPTEFTHCGGYFHIGDSTNNRELELDMRNDSGLACDYGAFGALQYATTGWYDTPHCCIPVSTKEYFGKDTLATIRVDADGAKIAFDAGSNVHTNSGKGVAPTSPLVSIGWYYGSNKAKFRLYSARFYSRALTDDEVRYNFEMDRARFVYPGRVRRSGQSFEYLVSAQAGEGGAVSADALWLAPDTATTLTATPEAGFTFRRWLGETDGLTDEQIASPTLALTVDRPRALTAQFVRPTTVPSAKAYAQDGLVAMFDGVENVGWGQHAAVADQWANLATGATDAILPSGKYTVTSNSIRFVKGSAYAQAVSCASNATPIAIEARLRATSSATVQNDLLCVNVSGRGGVGFDSRGSNGYSYYQPNCSTWGKQTYIYKWWGKFAFADRAYAKHTVTAFIPVNTTVNASAGSRVFQEGVSQAWYSSWTSGTQAAPNGRVYIGHSSVDYEMYCVRIYDRELTADEMAMNTIFDRMRFDGVSSNETGYAYFDEAVRCRVQVSSTGHGGIAMGSASAVTEGEVWKPRADSLTLTPAPDEGYKFFYWTGDTNGVEIAANGVITVTDGVPRALVCHFVESDSTGIIRQWSNVGATGVWSDENNWLPVGVPAKDDVVVIPSGTNLVIDVATPELYDFTCGGKLTFKNWSTCLKARTVTINSGATVTCKGPFNDTTDMSNRVWIAASESLLLASGAKINVTQLGYGCSTNLSGGGYGPGKADWSGGAVHGGVTVGCTRLYGDPAAPLVPGTSGGSGPMTARMYPGGGAVFLDCPNATVTVNGSITSDGYAGGDWSHGASTGGSIYIRTKRFKSSGATITAKGGNRSYRANSASGGRIAIAYDPDEEEVDDLDSSTWFSAECGLNGNNRAVANDQSYSNGGDMTTDGGHWAKPGTVWFTDAKLLGKALNNKTGFSGEILVGTGKSAVIDRGFAINSAYIVIGNHLTNVTVKGDVSINSVNAYLCVGASDYKWGYVKPFNFTSSSGVAPRLEIDGNLTMTMGSRLDLNGVLVPGWTNGLPGGVLDVKGDIVTSGQAYDSAKGLAQLTSIIYCSSPAEDGTGFHIFASNVTVGANSRFDGRECGYQQWDSVADTSGRGPGKGSRYIGAGHAGAGRGANATYGKTYGYGDLTRPCTPGSSGSPIDDASGKYGWRWHSSGGGAFRLVAYNHLAVAGGLRVDAISPGGKCVPGSGGSLWLEAKTFSASAGALISAAGGSPVAGQTYAGGGGRISLWLGAPGCAADEIAAYSEGAVEELDAPDGTFSVSGGGTNGVVLAGNGVLKVYNAVPKGQNLEINYEPLDAFGACDPDYGAYKVAAGSHTYAAIDVTNETTWIRSRCIGWRLEKLNATSGEYEPFDAGLTRTCTFTMDDATYRLTWRWTKEARLAVTPTAGGSVSLTEPPCDAGWYELGTEATLTAVAADGYAFTVWTGDVPADESTESPITLVMDCAKSVTCGFQAVVPGGQLFTWTGAAGNGKWYDVNNWRNDAKETGLPITNDRVAFPKNAGTVILDRPTAELSSVTVAAGVTLLLTNWTTCVRTQTMTVLSDGTVTCAGPFSDRYTDVYKNIDMSNRVWIVCGDLTVASGGTISADGKGYGEPAGISSSSARAYGPGGTANYGCGGAHGGVGYQRSRSVVLAKTYDSASDPELPGSSGGVSWVATRCSPGGGVVRVEATGTVRLDGAVTAKGSGCSGWDTCSGGGSGGTVYLSAKCFAANGGVVSAAGGWGYSATYPTAGGGGRVALHYDTTTQSMDDIQNLTLDAAPGASASSYRSAGARPGTVWCSDERFFRKLIPMDTVKGSPVAGTTRQLTLPGCVLSSGCLAFGGEVTNVTVEGDLKVTGTTAKLFLGADTIAYWSTDYVRFTADKVPYTLKVAGDFSVTDGAAVEFHPAPTNGIDGAQGGNVDVAGDFIVEGKGSVTSLVRVAAHPLVGSTVHFTAENVAVKNAGWISSDGFSWAMAVGQWGSGRGPSPGQAQGNPGDWNKTRGAGHGGNGVRGVKGRGLAYDSEMRPAMAGSSGESSWGWGQDGGGYIHVKARKRFTLAGRISADARMGSSDRGAAGSGGGILLESHRFFGAATARITAVGGNHTTEDVVSGSTTFAMGGPAGGGGRVAIWDGEPWHENVRLKWVRVKDQSEVFEEGATISVAGGASGWSGKYAPAEEGTVRIYHLVKPSLIIRVK